MKNLFVFLFLFIFKIATNAQVFAEVGAEWKYEIIYQYEIPIKKNTVKLLVTKDTVLMGKTVQKIQVYKAPTLKVNDVFFVSSEGQKIYYWEGLQKYLLYDFSLKKGDKYTLRFPSGLFSPLPPLPIIEIDVDSVGTISNNGKKLKVQYLSTTSGSFQFGKKAIEGIGFDNFILPTYTYPNSETNVFTSSFCFTNKSISLPEKGCKLVNNFDINQSQNIADAKVSGKIIALKLTVIKQQKGTFHLYDTQGNLAATYPLLQNHDEYRFDISNLANGMYFWHLVLDDKIRQTGKVVVMKE